MALHLADQCARLGGGDIKAGLLARCDLVDAAANDASAARSFAPARRDRFNLRSAALSGPLPAAGIAAGTRG